MANETDIIGSILSAKRFYAEFGFRFAASIPRSPFFSPVILIFQMAGIQGGFLRRVACQVLPLTRLGDKFRDWQEITNSIFCSRPLAGRRQQMEVWFYLK
jgi:hypothetical protein